MKIKYTEEQKKLLGICGVPSGLIYDHNIDFKKYIKSHIEDDKEGKPICNFSMLDQTKTIKRLADLPGKNRVMVFNSNEELTALRKFIVPWFYNECKRNIDNPQKTLGSLPLWHYVDFSFNDSLIEILTGKHNTLEYNSYKPLLVIDGVSTDSSSNKVEKLKDIINLSLDHLVIIILGGTNPFNFCKSRLGFLPRELVVFSHTITRKVL